MSLAEKFEQLIARSGREVREIERDADVPKDTLRNILRGISRDPGVTKVHKLATELGSSVAAMLQDELGSVSAEAPAGGAWESLLPIKYKTGGGNWVEVEAYTDPEPMLYPAVPVAGVKPTDQWYEQLEGDSMDRLIPSGALLHVVSTQAHNYKHGDVVIIERSRDGGQLVDRSAKQVAFTNVGVQLWPRSTNKKWVGPITIDGGIDDETMQAQIVGVVKRAIIPFP